MSTSVDHLPRELGALRIANDEVEVVVLSGKGADIHALVDRRSGIDVLFKTPWGARRPPAWPSTSTSLERWIDSYAGGWQLLLPNGGNECQEQGVTWGFHGEAAMIPWRVVDHAADAVSLEASLITAPVHIRRDLTLRGRSLRVHEVLTNASPQAIEVMWSHHPAFGAPFVDGSCILSVGCREVVADDLAPGTLMAPGTRHAWPVVETADGGREDLRRVPSPDEPRAVLAYLDDFSSGYFAVTNPTLNLGVGLRWPLDLFPTAWLWQEVHSGEGFPWFQRAYVIAVEPGTSYPGQGIVAVRSKGGALLRLGAGESRELVMDAVLFEGSTAVEAIDDDGVVHLAAT